MCGKYSYYSFLNSISSYFVLILNTNFIAPPVCFSLQSCSQIRNRNSLWWEKWKGNFLPIIKFLWMYADISCCLLSIETFFTHNFSVRLIRLGLNYRYKFELRFELAVCRFTDHNELVVIGGWDMGLAESLLGVARRSAWNFPNFFQNFPKKFLKAEK